MNYIQIKSFFSGVIKGMCTPKHFANLMRINENSEIRGKSFSEEMWIFMRFLKFMYNLLTKHIYISTICFSKNGTFFWHRI